MAQPTGESIGEPPPYISQLEDGVRLTRNATSDDAVLNAPLLDGDRVFTGPGRMAARWPQGAVLAADHDAIFDLQDSRTVRLIQGRVLVVTPVTAARDGELRVVTANAMIESRPGSRVLVGIQPEREWRNSTVVEVEDGAVLVTSDEGSLPVSTHEVAVVRGTERPIFVTDPTAVADASSAEFRQWSMAAAGDVYAPTAPAGATYLPNDLQVYDAALRRYGTWTQQGAEGWVWYPQVAVGWSPYSAGVWVNAGYYGWVWAGVEPWSWPTHHYGRWGWGPRGQWYWRPARHWAPAWVWWAVGPGHISWCALGWNNQPIAPAPFWTYDHDYYRHNVRWRPGHRPAPWRGWMTVPSRSFGSRAPVHRVAVDGWTLPRTDLRAFVTQQRPPRRAPGTAYVAAEPAIRFPVSQASAPVAERRRVPTGGGGAGDGRAAAPLRTPGPAPGYAGPVTPSYEQRGDQPGAGIARPGSDSWREPVYVTPGRPWRAPRNAAPQSDPAGVELERYERPTPFANPRWTSPLPGSAPGGIPRLRDAEPSAPPARPYQPRGHAAPEGVRSPAGEPRGARAAAPREGAGSAGGGGVSQRIPPSARGDGGARGNAGARPRR